VPLGGPVEHFIAFYPATAQINGKKPFITREELKFHAKIETS